MEVHDCIKETDFVAIKKDISHIQENLDLRLTSFHGEMRSNHELLMAEMKAYNEVLLERVENTANLQRKTNGSIGEHSKLIAAIFEKLEKDKEAVNKEIEGMKEKSREIIHHQWLSKWIVKHPISAIIIFLLAMTVITALVDFIGIKSVIQLVNTYK